MMDSIMYKTRTVCVAPDKLSIIRYCANVTTAQVHAFFKN